MTETQESLRERGGVDLTKLQVGVKVLVETTAGIYELIIVVPETGHVSVKGTVPPFQAHEAMQTTLEQSIWDDKGKVFIPCWIGKAMRMVFRDADQKLFATHSVMSAKVESPDGSWSYEVWENEP